MELDVGRGRVGSDAGEAAGLGEVGGKRPGLRRFVLFERRRLQCQQQALRLGRGPYELRGGMVREILTDRGLVQQHLDLARHQVFRGTYAREHQQLRRVVGAAAQHHLALGAQLLHLAEPAGLHTDRTRPLEQHPLDEHVGHHGQVGALHRGMQVGDGGARTETAALGDLVHTDAVLGIAIEVLVARQTGLLPRVDEGMRDQVVRALFAHRQRTAHPVPLRSAALVVLRLEEVRQQIRPRPAGNTPVVVVAVVAADVDHRVDRGGAAEHLAARQRDPPAEALPLGRRVVVPVDLRPGKFQVSQRHVDVLAGVRRPSLEQQHLDIRIFTQTVRKHAARRAGPNDHIVVHQPRPPPSPTRSTWAVASAQSNTPLSPPPSQDREASVVSRF